MGLDFVGSEAHWSYSGFHRFRERLGREIEITLDKMEGYGGTEPWDASDPITILLNHSDCDGEISPEDCACIAPRLLELVQYWPENNYDKVQALLLAKGMEECAQKKKPLRFT